MEQKRSYKEAEKKYIGSSDCARLILDGSDRVEHLMFGEDGSYDAYVIDEGYEIGEHYVRCAEFSGWLKIYDDEGLTAKFYGDTIEVYRAGQFGCIIKISKGEA